MDFIKARFNHTLNDIFGAKTKLNLEQKTILFLLFGSLIEYTLTGKRSIESYVIIS
jgi:hypothetical protein